MTGLIRLLRLQVAALHLHVAALLVLLGRTQTPTINLQAGAEDVAVVEGENVWLPLPQRPKPFLPLLSLLLLMLSVNFARVELANLTLATHVGNAADMHTSLLTGRIALDV